MSSSTQKAVFSGIATALFTPFRDGVIDLAAFRHLIDRQIKGGIQALVVAGTTGESATLDEKECDSLLSAALEEVDLRVPVIMGTGHNNTARALAFTKRAAALGAAAALTVTPYYNRATKSGIRRHFLHLAENSPIPIILYNVPSRTGVSLSLEDYRILCEHPNIAGVKEADTSIEKMAWLCRDLGEHVGVYTGNDSLLLPALALGASGAISVCSNLFPKTLATLYRCCQANDYTTAKATFARLLPLFSLLFQEVNPAPVKCAAFHLGLCQNELRLPLTEVDASLDLALQGQIKALDGIT